MSGVSSGGCGAGQKHDREGGRSEKNTTAIIQERFREKMASQGCRPTMELENGQVDVGSRNFRNFFKNFFTLQHPLQTNFQLTVKESPLPHLWLGLNGWKCHGSVCVYGNHRLDIVRVHPHRQREQQKRNKVAGVFKCKCSVDPQREVIVTRDSERFTKVSRIGAISRSDGGPAARHDHNASLKCQKRLSTTSSPVKASSTQILN
ncbi:hypothetical protein DPX16_2796 [Anabarilius grahami]|uniref:Uncharacterized protein n=1 Tax=Anabarilius grahami TaxID=495550 RepID=A0A3N0YWB2_ANAGA|nr:hypothetical protein DPX16_2796 [Anabarilius grahami]